MGKRIFFLIFSLFGRGFMAHQSCASQTIGLAKIMLSHKKDWKIRMAMDSFNKARGDFYSAMVKTEQWEAHPLVIRLQRESGFLKESLENVRNELEDLEKTMLERKDLEEGLKNLRKMKAYFYERMVSEGQAEAPRRGGTLGPTSFQNKVIMEVWAKAFDEAYSGLPYPGDIDPVGRSFFGRIKGIETHLEKMAKRFRPEDLGYYAKRADWAKHSDLEKKIKTIETSLSLSLISLERAKLEAFYERMKRTRGIDATHDGPMALALENLYQAINLLRAQGVSPTEDSLPPPLDYLFLKMLD